MERKREREKIRTTKEGKGFSTLSYDINQVSDGSRDSDTRDYWDGSLVNQSKKVLIFSLSTKLYSLRIQYKIHFCQDLLRGKS